MPQIMISYRRADSTAIVGRIFDRLASRYGKDAVFRDVDTMPLGVDFRKLLAETVHNSDVVLVVIGVQWLGRTGETSRIADEKDPVRMEVEAALASAAAVIPIFVDGATMPATALLPETIREFTDRSGQRLDSGEDFDHHILRLCRSLDTILADRERARRDAAPPQPIIDPEVLQNSLTRARGLAQRVFTRVSTSLALPETGAAGVMLEQPQQVLRAHSAIVLSIAFSPDSGRLASASLDRTTRIWDVSSGTPLLSLNSEPAGAALAAAYAPDGALLAVGNEDGSLALYDTRNGNGTATLSGFPGLGHRLSFSADGRVLRAGTLRIVKLWDLDVDEKPTATETTPTPLRATAPQPAAHNNRFAAFSGFADRLLDTANKLKLQTLYWTSGQWVAVSSDERLIAVAIDMTIAVREAGATENLRSISDAWGWGIRLALSADGAMLAVGSLLRPVRLWNVASGDALATLGPASIGAWAITFSPDGRHLATATKEGTVNLWDIGAVAQAGAPAPSGAGLP